MDIERKVMRSLKTLFAACCVLLFTSCSGMPRTSNFERVVAFGDSFTDQGNYAAVAESLGAQQAGRFTTNPDRMWIEHMATALGLSITARAQGGQNYAEGFARNLLAAPPQPGLSQTPVVQQVQMFLKTNKPTIRDLIVINGGGNDILIAAQIQAGVTPLDQAAQDFVATLTLLRNAGAERIFVVRTPNLGIAPVGGSGAGGAKNPLTVLVNYYNTRVQQAIEAAKLPVVMIDAYSFIDQLFNEPHKFGIKDVKTPACSNGDFASFACTRAQQLPDASTQLLMADKIHLAGRAQQLLGEYAADVVKRAR
jgi:outer membrane lipase/esterase